MKHCYPPTNTLSVPTLAVRHLWALLLLATSGVASTPTQAGLQHYQAPLDDVRWETSAQKLHCALSHEIPLYGRATFSQNAGEKLGFQLTVKRQATRTKDSAHLRAQPPAWKHQMSMVDLGKIPVHKGATPFQLEEGPSRRLLAELQKGMLATFSYRDWADARDQVNVALPGINIKPALEQFISCLANLPVYDFADFQNSLLYFAFGKDTLGTKERQRLDEVARYVKTDPELKAIEISGHTDNVGKRRNNDKLSKRRSRAAKNYLMSKGVSPQLLKIKSYGERQPQTSNRTEQGRAQNRRVLIKLVK